MDWVGLIQAVALLVMAVALLVGVVRGVRRLSVAIGKVHVVAEEVNRAVNHVEPGSPTLVQKVTKIGDRLEEHVAETNVRLDRIEDHITKPRKAAR